MNRVLTWLWLTPLIVFASAQMGGSTGGGYIVFCEDPISKISSLRLLDYYEADLLLPDLTRDLGTGASEVELAQNVLSRLQPLDPDRARIYSAKVRDFLRNTRFVDHHLPDVKDYGFAPLGDGCTLKQVAVQNLVPIPEGKKFTVHKPYWDKLSMEDRAGLILHEIIYEEALALGQKDSRNSRYFNALISSKKLGELSGAQYQDRLRAVGLPSRSGDQPSMVFELPKGLIPATVNEPFQFNIAAFVLSNETAPLRFYKLKGPKWANITSAGILSGTPRTSDVGKYVFKVSVTDGKVSAQGELTVEIERLGVRILPSATAGVGFSFDLLQKWPLEKDCRDSSVTLVYGPRWMGVSGTLLTGTPSSGDIGAYQAIFDLEQTCYVEVSETLPDGSVNSAKIPETRATRGYFKGYVEAANKAAGTDVPAGEYDEVVFTLSSGAGCQATLVGPRTLVSPASCVGNGRISRFVFRGETYDARLIKYPNGKNENLDFALGIVSRAVENALPLTIGGNLAIGSKVELLAFSDFSSGKGTRLQSHAHEVTAVQADVYLHESTSKKPSITFGNSGAPTLIGRRNKRIAGMVTGSSFDKNPQTVTSIRLDNPKVTQFIIDTAKQERVEICGVTTQCD